MCTSLPTQKIKRHIESITAPVHPTTITIVSDLERETTFSDTPRNRRESFLAIFPIQFLIDLLRPHVRFF